MHPLSVPDVRALAPDAASFAAARRLASSGAWSQVGAADALLWGRCQGSGATPYQVSVDLTGPTVTCTCPSRKSPCKHGLALLLRWAGGPRALTAADGSAPDVPPAPALDRAARPPRAGPVADPQAQQRRLDRRMVLMDDGMAEFDRWLVDLVTDGLASVRRRPYAWWDTVAGRLVDAQLPGLADRVRAMPGRLAGRDDWASVLLAEVSRWALAVTSWRHRDRLDLADAAELRTYLGWTRSAEEVLAGRRVPGRWTVLAVATAEHGRLTEQRTWLWHDDVGWAAVLEFAAGTASVSTPQLIGSHLDVDVAVYPGRAPHRIRFAADPIVSGHTADLPTACTGWDRALTEVAQTAATAPWQDRFPAAVADVRLVDVDEVPVLVDGSGQAVPALDLDGWATLALTGGRAASWFGEVLDGGFRPLTVATADGLAAVPTVVTTGDPAPW